MRAARTMLLFLGLVLPLACDGGEVAETPEAPAPVLVASDAALEAVDAYIARRAIDTQGLSWRTILPPPQWDLPFDPEHAYDWVLETNVGTIRIRLWPEVAPHHVASTLYLSSLGYYDTLTFHRIIPGFMAQGGDPKGDGTGGPGYQFAGETVPGVGHARPGMLSMANAGPGTDGSQFFITFTPQPNLDGKHTVFGEVVSGMDTVHALESFGSPNGSTVSPVVIHRARVEAVSR